MMERELKDGEDEVLLPPLNNFVVGSLPTILYIPNFITQSEQARLLHHIYEVSASRWKSLKNRRLQNWGGVVHEKGLLPQDLPPWLKKLTQRICQQTGLFPSDINHVLINEYLLDQGIMPHQDGPAYFPVVAILSLQSPLVIDFTPHPRLKECTDMEKVTAEDQATNGTTAEVGKNGSPDELVFREDSKVHRLDKVVNVSEISKLNETRIACRSDRKAEAGISEQCTYEGQNTCLHRTSTRVSLTCRLVLKVHKKLFKF